MDFEISAGQVKAMLKHGDKFTLLDVREPWELEKSHLEGSKNIPVESTVHARRNRRLGADGGSEGAAVLEHAASFWLLAAS